MKSRIVIYPKDIQQITGRSEWYGRRIIAKIKEQQGKEKEQLVTVKEFSEFIGILEEEVASFLK